MKPRSGYFVMGRASVVLAATLALSPVQTVMAQDAHPPLVGNVQQHDGECRMTVNGQKVTAEAVQKLVRAGQYRRGIIVFRGPNPYRCLGSAVYIFQKAGLQVDTAAWADD